MNVEASTNVNEGNGDPTVYRCIQPPGSSCNNAQCMSDCQKQFSKPGQCRAPTTGYTPICCCTMQA